MPRAQREQQILEIAGQVFARDGYHAAGMDEISRLAGVSKPMLYAYFDSKEGLYGAYLERSGQELVERMEQAFAGSAAVSTLRRVEAFFCFVEEHRDGWKVLFHEASASRPVAEQVFELRERIAGALRGVVEDGVRGQVSLSPQAADVIAHAIVGAGESLANWWLEHPRVSREQMSEWYASVITGAVASVTRPD